MTPGNNGASTPEDDDPFGYLYADGQARGAQPPTGSYGYPNAVNRVRPVGERQYGQQTQQSSSIHQAPTAAYSQVPQQNGYGQPNAQYQAPEAFPGGAPTTRQQTHGGGGGRGRGPNTKGLLIGAIAVLAAVVVGIGVAMIGGDDSGDDNAGGGASTAPTADQSTEPSPSTTKKTEQQPGELPKAEAKTLQLGGNATVSSDIPGAKSEGGFYVTNFNSVGSSVTWKMEDVPEAGKYTLYVLYGVPGKDQNATLSVNGTAQTRPLNLSNFSRGPEGDYEKGWTNTFALVQLNKGTNEVKISCEQGNSCDVNFDQMYLEKGWKS
ncbi:MULTISPECIES: CBM35 domain-containing protein [Streptomyces]|uniref:CBM35 domain-containing protein n=1 Tax=Streptomyces heilongjiangensis TaxID=945052 RepID=A0ABW1B4D9_9ACTN|nr:MULTISPECIES: CBM35 domain-containing protein [Streptomyces]MDC2946758.1 CBM35 domain-containing protein [Streptomyces heilongjiangensis]